MAVPLDLGDFGLWYMSVGMEWKSVLGCKIGVVLLSIRQGVAKDNICGQGLGRILIGFFEIIIVLFTVLTARAVAAREIIWSIALYFLIQWHTTSCNPSETHHLPATLKNIQFLWLSSYKEQSLWYQKYVVLLFSLTNYMLPFIYMKSQYLFWVHYFWLQFFLFLS